jgi:hypothetical protein
VDDQPPIDQPATDAEPQDAPGSAIDKPISGPDDPNAPPRGGSPGSVFPPGFDPPEDWDKPTIKNYRPDDVGEGEL